MMELIEDFENVTLGCDIETVVEAMALVMTALGVLIMFGNSLVIMSYVRFEWIRSNTSKCIVSMAIADLFIGLSAIPLHLGLGFFKLGIYETFCKAVYTIDPALCQVSILHILLVNIDRYIAISRPLSYPNIISHDRMSAGILLAWILGTVIALGPAINIYNYDDQCDVYVSMATATACSLVLFWLPFLAICVIYGHIISIANTNRCKAARASRTSGTMTSCSSAITPVAQKIHQNVGISQSTRRTLKTIACVIGAFGLCWGPYFIMFSVSTYMGHTACSVMAGQICSMLGYSNSLMNPLIYGYFNADFKRAFRKLLCFSAEVAPTQHLPTVSALVTSGRRSFRLNALGSSDLIGH